MPELEAVAGCRDASAISDFAGQDYEFAVISSVGVKWTNDGRQVAE